MQSLKGRVIMWKKIVVAIIALVGVCTMAFASTVKENNELQATSLNIGDKFRMSGVDWTYIGTDGESDIYLSNTIYERYINVGRWTSFPTTDEEIAIDEDNMITYLKSKEGDTDAKAKSLFEQIPYEKMHLPKYEWLKLVKANGLSFVEIADNPDGTYMFANVHTCPPNMKCGVNNGELFELDMNSGWSADLNLAIGKGPAAPVTISYKETPQDQSTYEYKKNVNTGTKIGEIISSGESYPGTISIIANPNAPSGHENDYENFVLASDKLELATSAVDVKITNNTTSSIVDGSLKAGTYYFTVKCMDASNRESTADVVVTVNKSDATVTFTKTGITNIKIGSNPITESITSTNSDLKIGGSEPSYAVTGGVMDTGLAANVSAANVKDFLITIGSNTVTGLPATFTLTVTTPETDNFKQATATKSILVYGDLIDLTWSPTKEEFTPDDVKASMTVGTLQAVGGYGPYRYAFASSTDAGYTQEASKDNAYFTIPSTAIASGTQKVTVNTALKPGVYHVQFKVLDSFDNMYIKNAEITVVAQSQAPLVFKDKAGGKQITAFSLAHLDTSKTLIAEGGSGSGAITYALAPADKQPTGISDASEYLYFQNASSGKITTKKIGTVVVRATKAADDVYSSSYVDIPVTILPAEQTITFKDETDPKKIKLNTTDVVEEANAILTSNSGDNSGVGGIIYSSSNENVVKIDPSTGAITTVGKGSAAITATLNGKVNNANYNENYETKSCEKLITVYEGMKLTWTASDVTANKIKIPDTAGILKAVDNTGKVSYSIKKGSADETVFKILNTEANPMTLQWNKAISAEDIINHKTGNVYKITIVAKDDNETLEQEITITVNLAENDFYFVKPSDGTTKITTLSDTYQKGKKVQLLTQTSNGGTVTYQPKDGGNASVLTVDDSGMVTIYGVGGPVTILATVEEGGGYAAKTIELPITITKGVYESISFDDPNKTYVAYTGTASSEQPATLKPAGGINYSVDDSTKDVCTIGPEGTVTALKAGTCKIKATSADKNFEAKSTTKEIVFYEGAAGNFTQTSTPQAGNTAAGSLVGVAEVEGEGVQKDNYSYSIHKEENNKNTDSALFNVDPVYGTVTLKEAITPEMIKGKKYDETKGGYVLYVQVDAKDSVTGDIVTIDCEIVIQGAAMPNVAFMDADGKATKKIQETYRKNGTFPLNLINNEGGKATYSYVSGPPDKDVIGTTILGNIVTILNANDEKVKTPVVVQAKIAGANGYEPTTITCVVEITKAEQKDFRFTTDTITMLPGSSVDPTWSGVESGETPRLYKSDNRSIVTVTDTTITSLKEVGSTTVRAEVEGNRNYLKALTTATVNVSDAQAYPFEIDMDDATYGDDDTNLKPTIIKDDHNTEAVVEKEWTSSNPNVATIDKTTGKITIKNAGSTTITCKQTSTMEAEVRSSIVFNVHKKPIEITIENKEKKVGADVPAFTVDIPMQDLVGNDEIEPPVLQCVDANGESVDIDTPEGDYPITGSYAEDAYPNYVITIVDGNLAILQDQAEDAWYSLIGNASKDIIPNDTWVKEAVHVTLNKKESGDYDRISLDEENWANEKILVAAEGTTSTGVYFKNSSTNARATSKEAIIRIDSTAPEITSISGEEVEQNSISKLLNFLTFGTFFKPQDEITIKAKDIQKENVNEVSGLKEINYEIYELDTKTGLPTSKTPIKTGTYTKDLENTSFRIVNTGLYRVCAVASDYADNDSTKKCYDLHVKQMNEDIDKDGTLDLNDSNGDNCPDLNIVLGEDKDGNPVKLNVAQENKNYPYMNIDSNGDGKADLNIDTDNDDRPDLNLVAMDESMWNPKTCVIVDKLKDYTKPVEYCTGTDAKPQINVDTTGNGIPNINIDNNGDMKPDINISKDGKTPAINIVKIDSWTPSANYDKDGFIYDSIGKGKTDPKPVTNIDTNGDGYPDVNIDFDGNGIPKINIDVDGDGIPDVDIDGDGDGIPDYNLDPDEDGNPTRNVIIIKDWIPEKTDCKKDGVEFGTMELQGTSILEDNNIQIEYEGGKFLPNTAIKVNDITSQLDDVTKEKIEEQAGDQELKKTYDIKYLENDTEQQPDGNVKVKIPVDPNIKNPVILIENEKGEFEKVKATEKDGYYVFDTDYIGKVSVIGDVEQEPDPTPDPGDDPTTDPSKDPSKDPATDPSKDPSTEPSKNTDTKPDASTGNKENPSTSVKGTYTQASSMNGIGGANTGDTTNLLLYLGICTAACSSMLLGIYKRKAK